MKWKDIEALLIELGAEFEEREGSRIAVILFEEVKVFHRTTLHLIQIKEQRQVSESGLRKMG